MKSLNHLMVRVNINTIALFFIFVLSSAWLQTVTHFSPAYLGIFLCVILIFCYITNGGYLKVSFSSLFLLYLLFIAYIIIEIVLTNSKGYEFQYIRFLLYNQLYMILILFCGKNQTKNDLLFLSTVYLKVTILFLGADFIYRIANFSIITTNPVYFFYNLKYNSLLFSSDSNYTGVLAIISYGFFLYLKNRFSYKNIVLQFLYILLTIATLSRAAIFTLLLLEYFSFNRYLLNKKKYLLFSIEICGVGYGVLILVLKYINDSSLLSKFAMLSGFLNYYLPHVDMYHFLFGYGWHEVGVDSAELLGGTQYGGHLFIILMIQGFGFIGFLFIILFLILSLFYSRGKTNYVIFPYIVVGFSSVPLLIPYMYAIIGMQLLLEKIDYKKVVA